MVMMDSNMDSKDKRDMLKEIDNVEGVKWTISMSSLVGASVPESMIPKDVKISGYVMDSVTGELKVVEP